MLICQQVSLLRDNLDIARRSGKRIGFVPTMGNLHEGHMQLVRLAREHCDIVVVSIFVNPLQFALNEDWEQYPRTFESDCAKLESEGCDLLFYPTEAEMYPNGMETQTKVEVPTMTNILCGASRPGHFLGVTTVVSKLFNMVQPDEAIFGIKDYQQLTVIRRMVEDLCIPIKITAAPIARAEDGLALSSRNSYLTEEERPKANLLYKALVATREKIQQGARNFADLEQTAMTELEKAGMRPDYFSIRQAVTLDPAEPDDTDLVLLVAVYLGNTRLIDNVTINL